MCQRAILIFLLTHLLQVKRHKQLVAGGHEGGMEELKDFVDKKVSVCCDRPIFQFFLLCIAAP